MVDMRSRLFVALAKLQVLILPCKGHHILLKDVSSLWGIPKILHMVKEAQLAVGYWKKENRKTIFERFSINHESPTVNVSGDHEGFTPFCFCLK